MLMSLPGDHARHHNRQHRGFGNQANQQVGAARPVQEQMRWPHRRIGLDGSRRKGEQSSALPKMSSCLSHKSGTASCSRVYEEKSAVDVWNEPENIAFGRDYLQVVPALQ